MRASISTSESETWEILGLLRSCDVIIESISLFTCVYSTCLPALCIRCRRVYSCGGLSSVKTNNIEKKASEISAKQTKYSVFEWHLQAFNRHLLFSFFRCRSIHIAYWTAKLIHLFISNLSRILVSPFMGRAKWTPILPTKWLVRYFIPKASSSKC